MVVVFCSGRRKDEDLHHVLFDVKTRGRPGEDLEVGRGHCRGCGRVLYRVPEILSDDVLTKMKALAKEKTMLDMTL